MIILNIIYENKKIEKKEFNHSVIIGRLKHGIDVYIDDTQISRKHCEIFKNNNQWFIKDLASSNGTFVNGKNLSPFLEVPLNTQDIISVGNSKITVIINNNEEIEINTNKESLYHPVLYKNQEVINSNIIKYDKIFSHFPTQNQQKIEKSNPTFSIFSIILIFSLSLVILFLSNDDKINIKVDYTKPIDTNDIRRGVKVEKVETVLLNHPDIFLSGNLEPIKEEICKSNFETIIEKIYVKEGDRVKDKMLLFSLDEKHFLKNIKNLKIKLKSYNLEVKKAKNEYDEVLKNIKTTQDDTKLAKEKLEEIKVTDIQKYQFYNKDKNTLDRSSATAIKLANLNSDSGQSKALKAKEKAIEDANGSYIEKENLYNLALENKEFKKSNLDNLEIELQKVKADLDLANEMLKNFKVYSTFEGFVEKIYFKEKEKILPDSAILKIVDTTKLFLEIDLPQENKKSIILNSQIEVEINNKKYIGNIDFISTNLDNNETYKVKIIIDNDNLLLKAKDLATIKLKKDSYKKNLIVPKNSIDDDKNGKYLFVVRNNVISKVYIKIIKEIDNKHVAIEAENLTNNDSVVIDGDDKINEHQKVKIIEDNLTKSI